MKYTIDRSTNSCSAELLDSGYKAYDASCSTDGKVYVTDVKASDFVKIRIYDIVRGTMQEWNPTIPTTRGLVRIAVNDEFIVINSDNDNYVYDKHRILQYRFQPSLPGVNYFLATYITDNSIFWGVTYSGRQLLIWNLQTNQTHFVPTGVNEHSVTGTHNGYIFTSRLKGNTIGVYSLEGSLLHYIPLESKNDNLAKTAAIKINEKETLLAYYGQILLLTLQP